MNLTVKSRKSKNKKGRIEQNFEIVIEFIGEIKAKKNG